MDYEIRQNENQKIIIARASGDWDADIDNQMVDEILEMVDKTGLRNVLLDIRELIFDLPLVQIFERAQYLREERQKYQTLSTKVAIVYPSIDKRTENSFNFFEDASQNRGLPYRTFKDYEEAMEWLTS